MKRIIAGLLIGLNMVMLCTFAHAAGRTQGEFLKLAVGAKPAAMGGTFVGIADTVDALYWNPAGLAQLEKREAALSHLDYVAGIYYEHAAYAQKVGGGVLAAGVNYLYTEDEYRDDNGNKGSRFTDYNALVSIAYAHSVTENILCGATLKTLSMKYDTEEEKGVCADAGVLVTVCDQVKVGAVLQNMGTQIKFKNDDEVPLPITLRVGTSYTCCNKLTAGVDAALVYKGETIVSVGGEYKVMQCLPIRAGYRFREGGNRLGGFDGVSLGLGLTVKNYTIDYAFTPFGDFASSHRVELLVRW